MLNSRVTAVLGPTNTGKTHYAIERMLAHRTGVIGLPLRLLAREVYDRIVHNAIELSTHKINVKKVGSFGTFDSQIATPLALVITELIHNALEHGLANSGENLRVEVSRRSNNCEVKIIDDGIGLPSDFKWDQSSNLGLQIVKTLTENELKGSIELVRVESETQAVLKF